MADQFVAEIRILPFNFAPIGWALCNGQLMPITQNTALFSLLGTFYGGDGKSTFALPDLQGMASMQQGQGPGLSQYFLGQTSGQENVTLLTSEMPAHNHILKDSPNNAEATSSTNNSLAIASSAIYSASAANDTMAGGALFPSGGDSPHSNMMPYLTMNFCIALQGIFPQRP